MEHLTYDRTKDIVRKLAKRIGDARAKTFRVTESRTSGYIFFRFGGSIAAQHGGSLGAVFSDWVIPYLEDVMPNGAEIVRANTETARLWTSILKS